MYKTIVLVFGTALISSCGTTGKLYLTPHYIQEHATPTQSTAPSKNFTALSPGGTN